MSAKPQELKLISHHLCPYVQRAVIVLHEKGVPFERVDIDLSRKPKWFLEASPLGKTPVLITGGEAIFESAVIVEYLEDTLPLPLHPANPLRRARHRSWIEFASATLNDIAAFYNAGDPSTLNMIRERLVGKFSTLEADLGAGPWFDGTRFSLVDAAFGPVFRYFDLFDRLGQFGFFDDRPGVTAWRQALAARPSVCAAVPEDYPERLRQFVASRGSALSARVT